MSSLNANLLSVLTLIWKDFEIVFEKINVKILKKSILIAIKIVRRRTYFLRLANTIFYIAEEKKAFMPKSVENIDIKATYAFKKSDKNSHHLIREQTLFSYNINVWSTLV